MNAQSRRWAKPQDFQNSQDRSDLSEAPVGGVPAGGVTKEPFAFGSFSLIMMKEPSPLPQWGNCRRAEGQTSKEREGGSLARSSSRLGCLRLIF